MTHAGTGWTITVGQAADVLRSMPEGSAQCCVTSPPYFGLRDYGVDGQIGLEPTPDAYVARLVEVFREVRRVLADDGTLWLNIGDSYSTSGGSTPGQRTDGIGQAGAEDGLRRCGVVAGTKPKDLIGIPWMLAFALRADGWYLRSDIIWSKPNPMPESVRDRPTKAHEYLFLLSKSRDYHYDCDAIKEPALVGNHPRTIVDNGPKQTPPGTPPHRGLRTSGLVKKQDGHGSRRYTGLNARWDAKEEAEGEVQMRNRRSVWSVASEPFPGAHFAVMPTELVRPCILAGCPLDGLVIDPFAGSGTVGVVSRRLGRGFAGIELKPAYAAMAARRIEDDAPLLNRAAG